MEGAERALEEAREIMIELVEQGKLVEAADLLFKRAFAPLYELVRRNAEQIAELDARLSARIEEVDVRLGRRLEQLSELVSRLTGEVGRLKG